MVDGMTVGWRWNDDHFTFTFPQRSASFASPVKGLFSHSHGGVFLKAFDRDNKHVEWSSVRLKPHLPRKHKYTSTLGFLSLDLTEEVRKDL